ncbi:uncharacterized protein LOC107271031 [Cephus cinctus]|uniref:Uncharacterized protein LOC107271031 n=1 Tax=Cephus cinctus TaxID=211228 RepID=A0AAJ7C5R4_CEPCN|nr:uncharacterized protein LOC107271031 [Cephus cinctus]XP_015602088.1 uncharacterized protein LOC107271031 [Cephus cinctus]
MDSTIKNKAPPYLPSQPMLPLTPPAQNSVYFQKGAELPFYPKAPPMDPLLPPSQGPSSNVTIIQQPQVPSASPKNKKLIISLVIAIIIAVFLMELIRFGMHYFQMEI